MGDGSRSKGDPGSLGSCVVDGMTNISRQHVSDKVPKTKPQARFRV